jgi:hypothetical protein
MSLTSSSLTKACEKARTVVHGIEPDQRREQANVGFGQLVTGQVATERVSRFINLLGK